MDCQVKCDEFEVFEIIVHLLFEEFLHLGLRYQPSDFLISIREKEYAKLEVEVFFQYFFFFSDYWIACCHMVPIVYHSIM